ncbi:uncharacterized protein LOC135698063 [Ochlerotatus camptorhynchus]|uniref:uncharacterized protein LOC135698063 n=1 Tax=Ochlerotatus camptorhynchus TaxID=644619 RepID=UPI0031D1DE24
MSPARVKLPPLVVKNAHLNELIADLASLGVKAKFKLGRVGTKVVLRTKAECDLVIVHLRTSKVEFFTHDILGEKLVKVVLRSLPNFDPKFKENEIRDRYKLAPSTVYLMTRKDENVKAYPDCLLLVHLQKGTVTLNALKAIRSINSIIVRWKPYRAGHRDLTQCQRCLNFRHGTRNCNIKPHCGNCVQNHATSKCAADEAVSSKCANC